MELFIYLVIIGIVAYTIWGYDINDKVTVILQRKAYLQAMEEQYQYLVRNGKDTVYVSSSYFTCRKEILISKSIPTMETIWDKWQKVIDGLQEQT